MRIVHIMTWYTPNRGYQENYLPYEQMKLGHDVEIITSNRLPLNCRKKPNDRIYPGIYYDKGVKIHRLPSLFEIRSVSALWLRGLNKKLISMNPDIVHAYGLMTFPTFQALRFCKKKEFKLFVDDHTDNDNFHVNTIFKKICLKLFEVFILPQLKREVAKFLPVNPFSKRLLLTKFNIPKAKIELAPLGADNELFRPDKEKRKRIRKKLGIEEDEILIISSGNFDQTKDIDILVKTMVTLYKKYENIKLLLLGKGSEDYMNGIYNMIKKNEINHKIIMHDFVQHEKLPGFYNAADIGVWPGKLGITIIEALGVGLPIVVCKSKATEFLISNNNGLSFERKDVSDLTTKLEKYVSDHEMRERHGKNSFELVKQELSWKALAKRSIEIYKK